MSRAYTESDAVRYLQTYLRAQRLADPTYPSVPVDGIFGSQTKYALTEFQRRNGLPPTGIADRVTWDMLYTQYLEITSENEPPSPIIPFPSSPSDYVIKLGERSFLVAVVQYMLGEIGAVYGFSDAPATDGEYGEETAEFVREFQRMSGLEDSGEVDRATWSALSRIFNLSVHYIDQR